MLGSAPLGPVVAAPDLRATAFACVLQGRTSLVLAPASERGWFGGTCVVAWDPVQHRGGVDLPVAGEGLDRVYRGEWPGMTAALLGYEGRCDLLHFTGGLLLTDQGWRTWGEPPRDAREVADAATDLEPSAPDAAEALVDHSRWSMSPRQYRAAVEDVRRSIAAGDVYVLNLTARLSGEARYEPCRCFEALVERADSDMNAFASGFHGSSSWLASVSPERFIRLTNGEGTSVAEVCPIKGTAPRGSSSEQDLISAEKLRADPKELAEHLMVVDLERNDLGRTCRPGSVEVAALYDIIQTPYCHQMVSSVRGELIDTASVGDLLAAVFPCGSVTGAPKIAAMRIAASHEPAARGLYCGALAVAVEGLLDSSVLIRTMEGIGRDVEWGAGCGITFESDPAAELLELQLKTSPVLGDGAPPVALRESMRAVWGRVPLLDRHLSRLVSGGVGVTLLARVRSAVSRELALCEAEPYARVSLTVTPDGEVSVGHSTEPSSLDVPGGLRLVPVAVKDPPQLPPGAAKPAARRYWDRAHRSARMEGGDQAVLVDAEGRLIDGTTANIWLVSGGALFTPQAPPAIAGVARELVFDLAAALGIQAEERELTRRDLDEADEVFFTNAVGIMAPVAGRSGEVYRRLHALALPQI